MDEQVTVAGPARRAEVTSPRLVGVDVARALALLGMVASHAALRDGSGEWVLTVSDERARLLFAVTAGLGLGLFTGGRRPPAPAAVPGEPGRDRATLRRRVGLRGLVLVVLGSLLTLLDPPLRVILDEYGLAFLLVVPLLFLPRRVLLPLALAGLAVLPGVVSLLAAEPWLRSQRDAWWGLLLDWTVTGSYPLPIWVPVLLLGVALTRLDLARRTVVLGLAAAATPAAVGLLIAGAWLASPELVAAGTLQRGDLTVAVATSLTVAGNVAAGLALVAWLVLLLDHSGAPLRGAARTLTSPLAAAGAMPLSLYTLHAVVLWGWEQIGGQQGWTLVVVLGGGLVLLAWLWRRYLGRGPLEQLIAGVAR